MTHFINDPFGLLKQNLVSEFALSSANIKVKALIDEFELTQVEIERFILAMSYRAAVAKKFRITCQEFMAYFADVTQSNQLGLLICALDEVAVAAEQAVNAGLMPYAAYHTFLHASELVADIKRCMESMTYTHLCQKTLFTKLAELAALYHDVVQDKGPYHNEKASTVVCIKATEAALNKLNSRGQNFTKIIHDLFQHIVVPLLNDVIVNATTLTKNKFISYWPILLRFESALMICDKNSPIHTYQHDLYPIYFIGSALGFLDVHRSLKLDLMQATRYRFNVVWSAAFRCTTKTHHCSLFYHDLYKLCSVEKIDQASFLCRVGQNCRMFIELNRFTNRLEKKEVDFFLELLDGYRHVKTIAEFEERTLGIDPRKMLLCFTAFVQSLSGEQVFALNQRPDLFETPLLYLAFLRDIDFKGWTKHVKHLRHLQRYLLSLNCDRVKIENFAVLMFIAAQQDGLELKEASRIKYRNRQHQTLPSLWFATPRPPEKNGSTTVRDMPFVGRRSRLKTAT